MTFANWPENIHKTDEQQKRMLSAASSALTPINIDYEVGIATFSGHHGTYQTTLSSCNCADFHARHLPCKHIYRLAHEICHIDLGQTVMHNAGDVINPDVEERMDRAIRIGLVIDEQPSSSYVPMLTVLRTIKKLGRQQSSVDSAIRYLENKVKAESVTDGTPANSIVYAEKNFVLTGDFSLFERAKAVEWLKSQGSNVSSSLSSKTNYLIIGRNPNDGKVRRAEAMGIPMLSEQEFLKIMQP